MTVHITDPSLCGPLRSLCGVRRPTSHVAASAVLAHVRGHTPDVCSECWFRFNGLHLQLELSL